MDMELELNPTFKPIYNYSKSNQMYLCCKKSNNGDINESTTMINKIFVGTKVVQDCSENGESNLTHNYVLNNHQQKIINTCKLCNRTTEQTPQDTSTTTPTPITNTNCKRSSPAPTNKVTIAKKITPPANTITKNKKIVKNFDITSGDTNTLIGKRELKFPDYNYIKLTHSEKLYNEFKKLLVEFDDIFAKHQYDRRIGIFFFGKCSYEQKNRKGKVWYERI